MKLMHLGFRDSGRVAETRERAVSALLDLGDGLRAYFRRDAVAGEIPAEGAAILLGAIEGEIIPCLLRSDAEDESTAPPPQSPAVTRDEQARFLKSILLESAGATLQHAHAALERGVTRETVCLDLLAFAARRLGELWEEDLCDFAEVTIGLCRLHQVLRELFLLEEPISQSLDAPRILLATACGDQHVFGVVMVAEFFRREGWRVWSEPGASRGQLAALLADKDFDVLGLSAACTVTPDEIASEIRTLRKASRNAELKVMVGGRLFVDDPRLVEFTGADGSAADAGSAPVAGKALLGARATN